jgi:hypothetical protein
VLSNPTGDQKRHPKERTEDTQKGHPTGQPSSARRLSKECAAAEKGDAHEDQRKAGEAFGEPHLTNAPTRCFGPLIQGVAAEGARQEMPIGATSFLLLRPAPGSPCPDLRTGVKAAAL